MTKRIAGIAVALAFMSGSVFAAGESGTSSGQTQSFNDLDTNKDGQISMQEAAPDQNLVQNWDQADKNKDGQVDESEFSAFEEEYGKEGAGGGGGMDGGAGGGTSGGGTSGGSSGGGM